MAVCLSDITKSDVLKILRPIRTANRENGGPHPLTQTTIFNHAINEEWRLDNPAGNSLDTSLPHRSKVVVHHRSLPYAHVPEAMSKVREYLGEPASRLGLEFLVHTAARVGEVCFATWEEIDLDNRTWTVPGPRLKARLRHRVPLSQRALVVLAEARETVSEDGIIFQNPKRADASQTPPLARAGLLP